MGCLAFGFSLEGSNVLRCLGSCSFALENYPTLYMYRRSGLVTRGGKELAVIGSIKSGA